MAALLLVVYHAFSPRQHPSLNQGQCRGDARISTSLPVICLNSLELCAINIIEQMTLSRRIATSRFGMCFEFQVISTLQQLGTSVDSHSPCPGIPGL